MHRSRVVKAHTKGRSFRTTIPIKVFDELGMKDGDSLDWMIEVRQGRKIICIRIMHA